ncbi:SusC/RagA family TonB-linked outer membrane protein [Pedobacter nototheniae]|uniref:SusC/RagA family TonB-linked outer membrane protein n=1 Tax=Pedobacter nototheniae TaxID=2488994 RepID=UPI001040C312|nr:MULTISPECIES: SusC/RagA family TonB-linked outer membrane protein [Pedobacter]
MNDLSHSLRSYIALFYPTIHKKPAFLGIKKALLVMKLTGIIILMITFQASATSFAQKVSISKKNTELKELFKEIHNQTGYDFIYNNDVLNFSSNFDVNVKNKEVSDLLNDIFLNKPLSFSIEDKNIIVKVKERSDVKPDRIITGRVIGSGDKLPLPGASIKVKGTTKAASTNNNGEFSIKVNDGDVLVFSMLGYITQEINTNGKTAINVSLVQSASNLNEVVITGIGGNVDKRTFTGATTKISVKDAELGGLPDPSRMLEGRVAGVSVQNTTGTFGTAPKIRVRGATSILGSSKPLWVVDGAILEDVADVSADDLASGDAMTLISSAVSGLNANDIESFQVLKDGSATSIYGARAKAGVIVITTKRGRSGYSQLNYVSEFTSRATPSYDGFNIMNSQEQMGFYQQIYQRGWLNLADVSNASNSGVYGKMYQLINSGQLLNTEEARNAYLRQAEYRNTDWFGELFSPNIMQNHSLSITSGTDKSQYYASASVVSDPGWAKQSQVKRYTANLNATYNISDKLKINILTSGNYRAQKAPGTLGRTTNPVTALVRRDFDINPYLYAMFTSRTLDPNESYTRNYASFNIMKELENNYMDINVAEVKFQGQVTWKVLKSLELNAFGSVRYQQTSQQHYIKDESNQAEAYRAMGTTIIRSNNPYLYKDPANPYALPVSILPAGGIYNRTDYKALVNDYRVNARYNNTFAEKHVLNVEGSASVNSIDRNNNWFRGWGLQYGLGEIPFVDYRIFKKAQEGNSQYYSVSNTRGREIAFFGKAAYSYDGKYSLEVTGRYEGSNRLGKSTSARWAPTWSVGGLWNASEEEFFKKLSTPISTLTFRGSYSLMADRGPSYVTNSLVVIGSYNPWRPNVTDNETGLQINDLENSQLGFEKQHELNLGMNFGLFQNRINGDINYYSRKQFDLIGPINTQGLGGQITKYGNIANMKSSGVEIALSGTIIKTPNFSWTANFNYTHATSEITNFLNRQRVIDLITGVNPISQQGYPARALFSIPFVGLREDGLPQFTNADYSTTVTGINFQSRVNLGYLKYEGSIDPTDFGGFGNVFTYKGFSFSPYITYSFGNVVRLNPVFKTAYSDLDATTREYFDAWNVPGDENKTNIPVVLDNRYIRNSSQYEYAYNAYNYSSATVAKGDFIRLKDISVAYQLPKAFLARIKVASASLRFNVSNLWLIYADKKLNGQDPEFANTGGVALPLAKQYTLTLKLGL